MKCNHTSYDRVGSYGSCVVCLENEIKKLKQDKENLLKIIHNQRNRIKNSKKDFIPR